MLNIIAIPALRDNYIWAIHDGNYVAIVDPGEAAPVLDFINQTGLKFTAILCTHRHNDHIGGIAELRGVYNVPVYGRSHPHNPHITSDLREGDVLELEAPHIRFDIIETPGHLEDHIVFIAADAVFCGDIMFGAGCGNNKEGTLADLYQSLMRLAALPDSTQVYCAHEYTEYCLAFAKLCEPKNRTIQQRIVDAHKLRAANLPTVPSTIALEKATNPFIRCTSPELIHTLQAHGLTATDELAVFTALQHF
ncbi:MAG: hydroxyacylglutathione hydrolase [Sideroxydans sp.]|nr:hydroxyacylglutathione hydrolase [Sideroxydans sp.]NOT98343.1 hydroxyacylglutathione hydrolase [Sideroxydans sp.]